VETSDEEEWSEEVSQCLKEALPDSLKKKWHSRNPGLFLDEEGQLYAIGFADEKTSKESLEELAWMDAQFFAIRNFMEKEGIIAHNLTLPPLRSPIYVHYQEKDGGEIVAVKALTKFCGKIKTSDGRADITPDIIKILQESAEDAKAEE